MWSVKLVGEISEDFDWWAQPAASRDLGQTELVQMKYTAVTVYYGNLKLATLENGCLFIKVYNPFSLAQVAFKKKI